MMDKEEIVRELLEMQMIDEAAAAILLDKVPAKVIPTFEQQQRSQPLKEYIKAQIQYRENKIKACGCTKCTCSLKYIDVSLQN
jgi:hypothetical protein